MPINWWLNCEIMNALLFTFLQVCSVSIAISSVRLLYKTTSFKIEMSMSCSKKVSTEYLLLKAPIILPKRCSCLGGQSQISPGKFTYPKLLLSQQLLSAVAGSCGLAADHCGYGGRR